MFKKTLIIAAVALFAVNSAEASCKKMPYLGHNQFDITVGEPAEVKLVLLDLGEDLYKVAIQDQASCKTVKKTMTFDQLSAKYGFSGDEFEDGCVDSPDPECVGE